MKISNYEEVQEAIDLYWVSRDEDLLMKIQSAINTIDGVRKEILKGLRFNIHYITLFTKELQVDVISDIIRNIKHNKNLAFDANEILLCVSDDVKEEVLASAEKESIKTIMYSIKTNIAVMMGLRRFGVSPSGISYFSALRKKQQWQKLYKLCKQNL